MEKSELIKKWLDNDLNPEELKAFMALEDYDDLIKFSTSLKKFKAPDFDANKSLEYIINQPKQKTEAKVLPLFKILGGIAASLLLCFGMYYFFTNGITNDTETLYAQVAQKTNGNLPDGSLVTLNAKSSLIFDTVNWKEKRVVKLKGEAFFKVEKGSKFSVLTEQGTVSVLGTEFNVKNRNTDFEVVCYEGSVQVSFEDQRTILLPGDIFKTGKLFKNATNKKVPSWTFNESDFKSEPFKNVIGEFERQYNVTIQTNNVDTQKLFTGKFSHTDLSIAIQAITLPFNLEYTKNGDKIILRSE